MTQPTPSSNFVGAAFPPPHVSEIAWLLAIPLTSPGLTTAERARITTIKNRATESRIIDRCTTLLAT